MPLISFALLFFPAQIFIVYVRLAGDLLKCSGQVALACAQAEQEPHLAAIHCVLGIFKDGI